MPDDEIGFSYAAMLAGIVSDPGDAVDNREFIWQLLKFLQKFKLGGALCVFGSGSLIDFCHSTRSQDKTIGVSQRISKIIMITI
jgi:hypothetical protein